MLRRIYFSAPIACILMTGCGNEPINSVNMPPAALDTPSEGRPLKAHNAVESVVKRFGGRKGVAIVANSAKTTAFRVGKLPQGKFDYDPEDENPPVPVTDDYPITAGPVTVPENVSAEAK